MDQKNYFKKWKKDKCKITTDEISNISRRIKIFLNWENL
jgi:hypothetical protein